MRIQNRNGHIMQSTYNVSDRFGSFLSVFIWPFLFCIRIGNFEGAHTGQTFLEISNGRKTVRMAPILTIFGPNESQRCQLNFAKFSRCRKSFREDENFKKLSRKVRKSLSRVRFRAKNKMETAIYLPSHVKTFTVHGNGK